MNQPTISIIIPNLNSPVIAKTLAALRKQTVDLDRCEVLVVGLDEPKQIECDALVRFISTGKAQSAAKNRNRGMAAAQGEILCFTDADCVPDEEWLQQISAYFEQSSMQVVGGSLSFPNDSYWATCDNLSWFYEFLPTSGKGERPHLPTCNLALRRSVVEAVGGMDESFPVAAGEDTEWTARMRQAGFPLFFDPAVAVTHLAQRSSWRQLWRHGYRYGQYSPKVKKRGDGSKMQEGIYRLLPQNGWVLLFLSPFVASLAVVRVVRSQSSLRIWRYIPGIWLSKLAWCLGASDSLRVRSRDE